VLTLWSRTSDSAMQDISGNRLRVYCDPSASQITRMEAICRYQTILEKRGGCTPNRCCDDSGVRHRWIRDVGDTCRLVDRESGR
jgi:hypothetical protein